MIFRIKKLDEYKIYIAFCNSCNTFFLFNLALNQKMKDQVLRLTALFFVLLFASSALFAQLPNKLEPQMASVDPMRDYSTENIKGGISLNIMVSNFGVSVGGEYRKVIGPLGEFYTAAHITGLRDVSEQTFQFFGQQVIPNKYERALAFPILFGYRQRFFANQISDNFRFNLSAAVGPAFVFSYPYFSDTNNNTIRDRFFTPVSIQEERINDFFTGWNDGNWSTGLAGEFQVGVDLGRKFKTLNGVKFGFQFFYIPDGLQLMEPFIPSRSDYDPSLAVGDPGFDENFEPLYDRLYFFVTPQITILFGKMW